MYEPTAMLGGVVKLQLPRDVTGFDGCKRLVQRGGGMGIEVVDDQSDAFRRGEILIHQPPHLLDKVAFGPLVSDVDVTPAAQRLDEQKQISRAFSFVFRVMTRRLARTSGQRMAGFTRQLHGAFVKAHLGYRGSSGSAYKSKTSSICQM